jgi:hypothetical protein
MLVALGLSACGGDGAGEQVVTVVSDPPGASCQVSRENLDLGTVPQTPGSLKVSKGVAPLVVACSAAGYETITGGFEARFRGNPITTPLTGISGQPPALDARNYAYPDRLMITLRR